MWVHCALTVPTYLDAQDFSGAHFGAGIGPIHLDTVQCSGSESSLIQCPKSSVNCTNGHSQDAGVRCQGIVYCFS